MKINLTLIAIAGCLATSAAYTADTTTTLSGHVIVDGSSTVFPVSEAVAEEFQTANSKVKVAVAMSGTGGGFKKFCKGEIDIAGASRPIEPAEVTACAEGKVEYVELPVGYDGIAIVTNPKNTWAKSLTTDELKKLWAPVEKGESHPITKWSDIRKGFPDKKIVLYGPGPDSGTFDYFTKAIVGKEKASRSDYTASEDDNALVKGVQGDEGALGYFGVAYYEANQKKLNLVPVDAGKGAIAPTTTTISNGTYPISRPIFIYVSKSSMEKPEIYAFTKFYIEQAHRLVPEVGYASLGQSLYTNVMQRFETKTTGSMFEDLKSKETLASLLTKSSAKNKTGKAANKKVKQ